jgi:ribonuclease R
MSKKKKKDGKGRLSYTGKLEITRGGMGFVIVEGLEKDVLIKRDNMGNALNGDEVRVEIPEFGRKFGSRPEGVITEVIKRKQNEFSGRVEVKEHFAFMLPDNEKMPVDIYIPLHLLNGAKHGDHVMAKIVEWTGKAKNPVGEVIAILTNEAANEIAMKGILVENGFPLHFPDEVLEEAARYPEGVDSKEAKKRRDMRGTLTITLSMPKTLTMPSPSSH